MDKQRFRIDKNEKLIALLEGRTYTITNNYPPDSNNLSKPSTPQIVTIMSKPIVTDRIPKDGQALIYNSEEKYWEAGNVVSESGGNVDGGEPNSVYGGIDGIDGEGV